MADDAGLTWTLRKQFNTGLTIRHTYEYYAIATSALSSDTITITADSNRTIRALAFGISGANTSTPYDSNASLPATGSCSFCTSLSISINTSNADDFIIGLFANGGGGGTEGSGYTLITKVSTGPMILAEYKIVSTTQSGLGVTETATGNQPLTGIADAVVQA